MLALWGCYEPDPSAIGSGLEREQRLPDLSAAEAVRLCEATNEASMANYSSEVQAESVCSIQALLFLGAFTPGAQVDVSVCERDRDACVERRRDEFEGIALCNDRWLRWFGSCSATVAEYERCITAMLRAGAAEFSNRYSCARAAEGKFAQMEALVVPECEHFESLCGPLQMPEQ